MEALGCDLLMVCSNVSPDSLGGIDRAAADLRELGDRAARRGMRVAFEALAWGRHINDYRDAWEAVRRADHPAVGLVLDTFHILARGTDLSAIRAIPRDRIFLVQAADAPRLDMDYLSWSRHFRNFPGQGDFPLDDFMDALAATGFDGLFSLEIFNDQFRSGLDASGRDRRPSLAHQSARPAARALRPGRCRPDPDAGAGEVPGRRVHRVRHRRPGGRSLRAHVAGVGLSPRRPAHLQAVTRWCQGDINIVVNTEKEGFAHSYNITHGTAVCALGLRVDDAAAALDRAQLLLDMPFRQAVGPGELEIPAVRGLGGSLIYFIDPKTDLGRVWDIEFAHVTGGRLSQGRRRPAAGRSHLAKVDALRGDAELAACSTPRCSRSRRRRRRTCSIRAGW